MEVIIIGIIFGSLLIFSPAKKEQQQQAEQVAPKPTCTATPNQK